MRAKYCNTASLASGDALTNVLKIWKRELCQCVWLLADNFCIRDNELASFSGPLEGLQMRIRCRSSSASQAQRSTFVQFLAEEV